MGTLYLLPTPIDEFHKLESTTVEEILTLLNKDKTIILVEEIKVCRRRWLHFGLPREKIEQMIEFNEHTVDKLNQDILQKLRDDADVILMSDCGTPAWMDPGQELVNLCHQHNIKVTSFNLNNSLILSLILSGFKHEEFHFYGFPPKTDREKFWEKVWQSKETAIVMDTPYRLNKVISEMKAISEKTNKNKEVFLGLDLNSKDEKLIRTKINNFPILDEKREFMIVIGGSK